MNLRTYITSLFACGALLLAACGSDDEGKQLPASAAAELNRQLGFIENAIDAPSAGACRSVLEGAQPNRDAVERTLDSLPQDVDPELRDATQDSFDHLFQLVEQECEDRERAEQETETDTEPEPTPTVTETVPPETETTPPETETTPPQTTPQEPDGGNGNGNGNRNGNGLGNGCQQAPGRGD